VDCERVWLDLLYAAAQTTATSCRRTPQIAPDRVRRVVHHADGCARCDCSFVVAALKLTQCTQLQASFLASRQLALQDVDAAVLSP